MGFVLVLCGLYVCFMLVSIWILCGFHFWFHLGFSFGFDACFMMVLLGFDFASSWRLVWVLFWFYLGSMLVLFGFYSFVLNFGFGLRSICSFLWGGLFGLCVGFIWVFCVFKLCIMLVSILVLCGLDVGFILGSIFGFYFGFYVGSVLVRFGFNLFFGLLLLWLRLGSCVVFYLGLISV